MCWKRSSLSNFTKNTIVHIAVGDYKGTVNDLDGPPYDQKDFKTMVSSKWNNYVYRNYLDSKATSSTFLGDLKKAVALIGENDLLFFINDNCYSATNTKARSNANILNYRFYPNPVLPSRRITRSRAMAKAGNYIAMSACLDSQTAADAMFDHPNGAYHYALIKTAEKGITYLEWHQRTYSLLMQLGFNQSCTIEGPYDKVNKKIFEGNVYCFVLSSHGSFTYDVNGDESDGQDEGPYLYDRMILDDEINAIIATNKYLY